MLLLAFAWCSVVDCGLMPSCGLLGFRDAQLLDSEHIALSDTVRAAVSSRELGRRRLQMLLPMAPGTTHSSKKGLSNCVLFCKSVSVGLDGH